MKISSLFAPAAAAASLSLSLIATSNVRDVVAVVAAAAAKRNGVGGDGHGLLRSSSNPTTIVVEKKEPDATTQERRRSPPDGDDVAEDAPAAVPSEEEAEEASRRRGLLFKKERIKEKKKTRTDVLAKKAAARGRGRRRRKPRPARKKPEEEKPEGPPLYVSTSGPLPVTLKRFGPSILDPYGNCDDAKVDLTNALKYHANYLIERNQNWMYREYVMDDVMVAGDVAKDAKTSDGGEGGGGETSYGTNNQDENVDEADAVKSDGTCVYAAYGDGVVVSDASTGDVLGRVVVLASDGGKQQTADDVGIAKPLFSNERIAILPDPKPRVRSLLLDAESNRLVVIVTMHGHYHRFGDGASSSSVLSGWGSTHVRIYDTSAAPSTGKLKLLAAKDLQGNYQSARSIGSKAYVVTMSDVVTWHHFDRYFERYMFDVKTSEEYVAEATKTAEKIVPDFADRLLKEITADLDGGCSNLVQINIMDTSTGGGDGSKADDDAPKDMEGSDNLLKSLAQIAGFDMAAEYADSSATTEEPETSTSTSTTTPEEDPEASPPPAIVNASVTGAFLPAHSAEVYASEKVLVLAGRGHRYDSDTMSYKQRAYLLGFRLTDDGTAVASACGSLEGYLLNQFAMDEHDGYLRVASSVRRSWGRVTVVDEETGESTSEWRPLGDNSNRITIFRFPTSTDGTTTTNRELEVVGKLDEGLGKPGELIHSTRFAGDYAYVVTFERIDPFYVIDLTVPTNPTIVGELEISGFSNYLHPIGDDLIIAAGQDAHNETGRPLGFQISLFNVSDHTNPTLVTKYVLKKGDGGHSGSAAQHDHRALRWLPQSKVLIVPVYEYDYKDPANNFDGFVAYDVNPAEGMIRPRFEVSHARGSSMHDGYCWYPAYLSPRSMVFNGNLMTMKGHTVVGRRLSDGDGLWEMNYDRVMPKESYSCMNYIQTRTLA